MVKLKAAEKKRLWKEVRQEFPGDEMMQQIHYVRLLHHYQTKDGSPQEVVRFFKSPYKKTHA
ncbi:hypothetical protein ACFL6S_20910 [Candidatus Poribacteria bacterium]